MKRMGNCTVPEWLRQGCGRVRGEGTVLLKTLGEPDASIAEDDELVLLLWRDERNPLDTQAIFSLLGCCISCITAKNRWIKALHQATNHLHTQCPKNEKKENTRLNKYMDKDIFRVLMIAFEQQFDRTIRPQPVSNPATIFLCVFEFSVINSHKRKHEKQKSWKHFLNSSEKCLDQEKPNWCISSSYTFQFLTLLWMHT